MTLFCVMALLLLLMIMTAIDRACTCPGSEHPGPDVSVGRGSPEIDIFEAQKNKLGTGGKVSQSAQFAPFYHDYVSLNGTGQATFFNPAITAQNTYQGSALCVYIFVSFSLSRVSCSFFVLLPGSKL